MTPALMRIFMVSTAAVLLSVLTGIAGAAERVALVIGNAAYEHTTPLRNPRNDASDVARALDGLGFEVIEGLDLDKSAFGPKLREFAQAARGAQVTLFFYAGHGLQVDGENYLVPTDAKLAEEVDLRLEAFELAAFLRQMRGGTNLVFLDACRDNPLAQGLARSMGPTRSSAIGRGLGRVETAGGTLIAYATQPGNVADDGEGRNSPFTGALLAHIATPGLSVHDLLASVTDSVVTGTDGRQQPWTHSSLRKPFYFKAAAPRPSEPSEEAQKAYAAAERIGTIAAFQTVAGRFPGSAHAEQARTQIARLVAGKAPTEVEMVFWESVKDSRHPADIRAYLDLYPGGAYEVLARNRLGRLEGTSEETEPFGLGAAAPDSASSESARVEAERLATEREFWASVKGSEEPEELQAYLDRYPDGPYVVLARSRLKRLEDTTTDTEEESEVVASAQNVQVLAGSAVAAAPSQPAPSVVAPTGPTPRDVESSLNLIRAKRRLVQRGLASLGYGPGPADGLFGAGTREAIRRYQGEKGFDETGYLRAEESETLVALGEESAKAQAEARAAAYSSAKSKGTVEAYESYLGVYPMGRDVAEARRLRSEAEHHEEKRRAEVARHADDAAFANAQSKGTVEAYEAYFDAFPSGRHAADAGRLRVEAARRASAPVRRFRDCAECPELVVVPSGSFMMGSPPGEEGQYGRERPVHRVGIAEPFAVGVFEVTFAEWETCRRGGGCTHNPGDNGWGRGPRPVINVESRDAREYVRWLSRKTGERYRLLSESEWEYVARAGTETRYWWGDEVGRGRANCGRCGSQWDGERTAPVGSFSANAFGLYDVHGNVWEWVEDCLHPDYVGAPGDGRAWTSGGACGSRVLRGGSWSSTPRHVRSAYRPSWFVGERFSGVGFRVARTLD